VQITGVAGVPSDAVAVVINLTATNTTANSYLTAYATGTERGEVSSLNWLKGQTLPNLLTLRPNAQGKITFYNYSGSVDLVGDVSGYYKALDTYSKAELDAKMAPFSALDPTKQYTKAQADARFATLEQLAAHSASDDDARKELDAAMAKAEDASTKGDDNSKKVSDLTDELAQSAQDLKDLQDMVDGLDATHKADVDALNTSIADVHVQIDAANSDLSNLQALKADNADVDALALRVSALESSVTVLTNTVNHLSDSDIANQQNISDLQKAIKRTVVTGDAVTGMTGTAVATCPAGTVVVGGGFTSTATHPVGVTSSAPISETAWSVGYTLDAADAAASVSASAVCLGTATPV
jgi:hypothetical protein